MNILSVFQRKYSPLNTIEISEKALRANYYYLSKLSPDVMVAPVLKSNAYGHGLQIVAKILDAVKAPFYCVDSLYEAYELQKSNVRTPILITGYVDPTNLKGRELPFSYAVYDEEQVAGISKYQKNPAVHIFVDIGMRREGILISELPEFLDYIKKITNIRVEGVMSHLSAGENRSMTKKQLEQFEIAKQLVYTAGFRPKWFHVAASSGLLHHADYKDKIGNLSRCGIALYGIDPEGKDRQLQPTLAFKTTLNQIKTIKKGDKVGYDSTYTASKNMTIGILPVGYYDGIDRRLSNTGSVLINNELCRIIGRVSMNLTTIDISNLKHAQVGDTVIVYSNKPSDKNSIFHASFLPETISYEFLVHLAPSTKRKVV
jgi:alanine racemase